MVIWTSKSNRLIIVATDYSVTFLIPMQLYSVTYSIEQAIRIIEGVINDR